MDIKRDYASFFRGNWSAKIASFKDFNELAAEAGERFRASGGAAEVPARRLKRYQRAVSRGSAKAHAGFGPALDALIAPHLNSRREIEIGGRLYRLSRPADQLALVEGLRGGFEADWALRGLVQDIMCYNFEATKPVCVSVNTDTHLPSFSAAHVEHWEESSYITTWFDTTANGRLSRVQLWKGHLLALGMTGAEISVWKPDTRHVLRCSGFLRCKIVEEEYFGPFWYPYMDNQLTISWKLTDKATGRVLLDFGTATAYETATKWWAGKWIDHEAVPDAPKKGEDYVISYTVRDAAGIVASGESSW